MYMYKNSSAPLNNTALWHYLSTKQLDFRRENNNTPRGINQGNTVIIIQSVLKELMQPVLI